jgi:cytochrome c5
MYTGILHTHKLVVILFLLLYVVKTFLLLTNKKELLEQVKKYTKITEMIISFTFLATGLYLLVMGVETTSMFQWIKFVAVFASIPLAVIGFKKENKILATLSLLLIVAAYGLAEVNKSRRVSKKVIAENIIAEPTQTNYDINLHGKAIFNGYCIVCHGEDGKLGLNGAKDLSISTLTDEEIKNIILHGKNGMSPYKKVLTEQEVEAVKNHVKNLRK